jgi:pimeloyl-ACP methyl ester carboxylesterase
MSSVEVYYELTGSADSPVLVLAGPLGSTLHIWQPHVESLATEFQVLRYDHRGHGRSPVRHGSFAIQDLALDALALLDRLGIERAAFCGLSLGGMVGIWLAAHAPERVSLLVLCNTTARYDRSRSVHRARSISSLARYGWDRRRGGHRVVHPRVGRSAPPGSRAVHPNDRQYIR